MKKFRLFCLFSLVSVISFASFPVETQVLLSEVDPEKFKLDTLGFVLGVLTLWLIPLYLLPLLLLFVKKKNFRGSLAWGWLAGLILTLVIILIVFFIESEGLSSILLY